MSFHISRSDRRVTDLGARSGTRLVEAGTTIFVVRGMSLKKEFRIGVARRTVAFGQDCKALVPRPGIDGLYLGYAILAQTDRILGMVDEAGHGTGRLATDLLQALTIRVPLEAEQRAIAEVLGALDDKIIANETARRAAREEGMALFDRARSRGFAPCPSRTAVSP